jgi:hypothetical protein
LGIDPATFRSVAQCLNHWGRVEVLTGFLWGTLMERDNLEDVGFGGRIIFKWISEKWGGDMDWINLGWYRDRKWAVVNSVM